MGVLFAYSLDFLCRKIEASIEVFYPCVIFLNFVLSLMVLHPGLWNSSLMDLLADFSVFQVCAFGIAKIMKGKEVFWVRIKEKKILFWLMVSVFLAWILSLPLNWRQVMPPQTASGWVFYAGIYWLFYFVTNRYSVIPPPSAPNSETSIWKTGKGLALYGLIFLLIFCLVIDPKFGMDRANVSFYLGPLADLAKGKSLLVNINSQYGILVFYFLSFFFNLMPLGYTSFTLFGELLIVFQFLIIYFIVRKLFQIEIYSFLCLIMLILINFCLTKVNFPDYYPSVGPLRFGFIYLLMALVVLRNRNSIWEKRILILESGLVASAFFWSFEVCIYTVPAYLALTAYESILFQGGRINLNVSRLGSCLVLVLEWMCLIGFFLYVDIWRRSHEWPHWSYYFDYLKTYREGLSMLPMPGLGAWWMIIGVLYFSAFMILGFFFSQGKKHQPKDLNVIALLNFYGITQFLYYLYRSHPNNLLHISMPALLIVFYWFHYLRGWIRSFVPAGIRFGFFMLVILLGEELFPRS